MDQGLRGGGNGLQKMLFGLKSDWNSVHICFEWTDEWTDELMSMNKQIKHMKFRSPIKRKQLGF